MSLWLITGGAGFIGSNIVEYLVRQGERVRVLDNFSTGSEKNLDDINGEFELIRGDVRDIDVCRKATKRVDYVLHQAALGSVIRSIEDPLETHSSNATGTLNMLIAARDEGVKRFVCAGSSSVYGRNPELPKKEDMTLMPVSPYGVSKLAQEQYCIAFNECYGFETVVLRYFNIFGPRQNFNSIYSAVIPKFMKASLENYSPEIYGDGEQTRDFTFVEDCVQANIKAVKAELNEHRIFNIGGGRQIIVNQLWELIKKLADCELEPKHVKPRPGEVRHNLADISKAKAVLGWEPKVSLQEGLSRMKQFITGKNI